MVQLPLKIDSSITSECWTFLRTAIIETMPLGKEWMSCHFNIFMDDKGNINFGDINRIYSMSYYDDVLQHDFISLNDFDIRNINEMFITEIDKGHYILVNTDNNVLFNRNDEEGNIHELLLIGYNENNTFSCPLISGNSRKYKLQNIDNDKLKISVENAINYYFKYPFEKYTYYCHYNFPITIIKIKDLFYTKNMLILKTLNKINAELNGNCYKILDINKRSDDGTKYYTGISCLIGLNRMIIDLYKNNILNLNMTINIFKLYEHRKIICDSLDLLKSYLVINNVEFDNAYAIYYSQLIKLQKCYMLAKKIEFSQQYYKYLFIAENLEEIYKIEYESLNNMFQIIQVKIITIL
jgi:hypothetical protein